MSDINCEKTFPAEIFHSRPLSRWKDAGQTKFSCCDLFRLNIWCNENSSSDWNFFYPTLINSQAGLDAFFVRFVSLFIYSSRGFVLLNRYHLIRLMIFFCSPAQWRFSKPTPFVLLSSSQSKTFFGDINELESNDPLGKLLGSMSNEILLHCTAWWSFLFCFSSSRLKFFLPLHNKITQFASFFRLLFNQLTPSTSFYKKAKNCFASNFDRAGFNGVKRL